MPLKRYLLPLAFFAALAAAILLSNRPVVGQNGVPLINNLDHYDQVLREAEGLVSAPFQKSDLGEELSADDRKALEKSTSLFDALLAYKPRRIGPYLGAGKAYGLLGDDETAETRLLQMISIQPTYENTDAGRRAVVDAKYVLSTVRFRQGRFEEALSLADEAVRAAPNIPNYYVAHAEAAIELRKFEDAEQDLAAALRADPTHGKALRLSKLLKSRAP